MNINASIVDQQISGILEQHSDWVPYPNDIPKQKSAAFIILCMSSCLEIEQFEAAELLTEGGGDAGVDGLHIGDPEDGEFTVTIFQGKYKQDLEAKSAFPANGVEKSIATVGTLFDPQKTVTLNDRIKPKVEEIRSMVRDGLIPIVRTVLCNNGLKWDVTAQQMIDQSGFPSEQAQWLYYNHDQIVDVLRSTKAVDDTLAFVGKSVVEEFNFRRVLVGKVNVAEIAQLFNRHGDLLLQRNIRRYLGLNPNRVNTAIHRTLSNEEGRGNFYFFNNGITVTCKKFRHNAMQGENFQVRLEGMQVINGGQTCKTIQQTLNNPDLFAQFSNSFVLVRIYELADDDSNFVREITYATNSQNPVDLRDLRSNDDVQKQLEIGMSDLGYTYKRQREEGGAGSFILTSSIVAESVLAIWRKSPHQAKFRRREHFGKLYETIFNDLGASQAIIANLIFREVENERKRPTSQNPPIFMPYASHYIAMLIGGDLLLMLNLKAIEQLDHRNFGLAKEMIEGHFTTMHQSAVINIQNALTDLYGEREISLQQLSATFRRGDLLSLLHS